MTDLEFDVLDELYFVTSFQDLQETLSIPEERLQGLLYDLMEKGWVKCLKSFSEELMPNKENFLHNFGNYQYLATKAGLLAHNRRD